MPDRIDATLKVTMLAAGITAANRAAMDRRAVSLWTVYRQQDFPDCYTARRFEAAGNDGIVATEDVVTSDLDTIRTAMLACGYFCITRAAQDDPNIIESWV